MELQGGEICFFMYIHMYVLVKVCSGKRLAPRASHKLSNYKILYVLFFTSFDVSESLMTG